LVLSLGVAAAEEVAVVPVAMTGGQPPKQVFGYSTPLSTLLRLRW
jgi:hypothetical protein